MHLPKDLAVLNTIQAAAADILLSGGRLSLNDGSVDILEEIKLSDGEGFLKIAYAVGTASVKDEDFAGGITLAAESQYRVATVVDGRTDFSGGGQEANQLISIREYVVWTGTVAPTAASLAQLFMDKINLDPQKTVTATVVADKLRLTLDDVTEGDFRTEVEAGVTSTVVTPFVEPAGTPAIVEALAPLQSSPTATYTTWKIDYKHYYKHAGVSGMEARKGEYVYIFADAGAANYAAFETELDAVLAGTHTPTADYLGM